jgi:hypothetical protein
MRLAVAVGLVLGLTAALIPAALAALGFPRCIDSPQFLNPQPLAWAGGGVGLMTTGAMLLGSAKHPRLGATALVLGVLFIGYALAGPSYHSCLPWEGLRIG